MIKNIFYLRSMKTLAGYGEPLTQEGFKELISVRENDSSMSLKEAKTKWAKKKKQLLKLIK